MDFLLPSDYTEILHNFNKPIEEPSPKTLQQIFAERVEINPDHPALILAGENLTYRELNAEANKLAHLLKKHGVESETIVGIMAERSREMVIGIFAILKAGGAYLPLNPLEPEDRLNYLLDDSGAKIVLVEESLLQRCTHCETISLTASTYAGEESASLCAQK